MTSFKKTKPRANDLDVIIGRNIKNLRLMRNVTQVELAESIGVTFQQLQKYENGQNRISAARLSQAAVFFKVNPSILLGAYEDNGQNEKLQSVLANADKDVFELINLYQSISSPELKKSLLQLLRTQSKLPKV